MTGERLGFQEINGGMETSLHYALMMALDIANFASTNRETGEIDQNLNASYRHWLAHGYRVASLGNIYLNRFPASLSPDVSNNGILLGMMVHDFGKPPFSYHGKRIYDDYNYWVHIPENVKHLLMQEHIFEGLNLLDRYSDATGISIPAVTRRIIENHHERMDGSGYPQAKISILPYPVRLTGILDVLIAQCEPRGNDFKKTTLADAWNNMFTKYSGKFDNEIMAKVRVLLEENRHMDVTILRRFGDWKKED